jgi:type IV pilus assembly protein PilC
MAIFQWKGKNRYGDIVKGERMSNSREELVATLQKEQIQIISVAAKRGGLSIPFLKREKVKLKELAVLSRQLSVLIDAELPLIQSLSLLADQSKNQYFRRVLNEVKEDVEAGSTLHQALRKHPKVFDDLFCNMIASGEQSGSLDVMLRRLAEYIEKIVKLRSQIRQAMIYPSAIVSFAIIVAFFLLWKVIPVFAGIFIELGAELPTMTAMIINLSNFIQKFALVIFGVVIVGIAVFRYWKKTPQGRWVWDRFLLRLPILGNLLQKIAVSRMTRTLSTLIAGGVPMLEALKITSTTTGNALIEKQILDARQLVSEGKTLHDAFQEAGTFPLMMIQMVNVGEATGTLDEMLTKLANFYDDEVEAAVAAFLSVLEPILMIFVGGLVGGLVISMYLPIFSLMQKF